MADLMAYFPLSRLARRYVVINSNGMESCEPLRVLVNVVWVLYFSGMYISMTGSLGPFTGVTGFSGCNPLPRPEPNLGKNVFTGTLEPAI